MIVTSPNDLNLGATALRLAKNIGDVLERHYPSSLGHWWAVQVRPDQGIVTIRNTALGWSYGFLLRITDIDPRLKKVVWAAGELLERYRVSRSRTGAVAVQQQIADAKRNARGEAAIDV